MYGLERHAAPVEVAVEHREVRERAAVAALGGGSNGRTVPNVRSCITPLVRRSVA